VTIPPVAPTARAARAEPTALAIAAVLAVGLLTSSVGTAGGAPPDPNKASSLTIAGTTVTSDGRTPVPRVRITIMPESTVTFTDIDGDFLAAWNGHEGWITVIPEERDRNGGEWCKRVVLREATAENPGPIVDVGMITVMAKAQVGYHNGLVAPPSHRRPTSMHAPGPKPGEPDTCRVQLSYAANVWGRITRIEVSGGEEPPPGLRDAIFSWIRSVPWTVASESPCDTPEPFQTRQWLDYAWADSAWVEIPGLKLQDRAKRLEGAPQSR
jgi:hypothetical protein